MSSIIEGYEYDIFISYRHNDNRSGWVTDFVNALQEELAATIKEPLSIYFDKNPQDGLLETHNVDKSLEGKLKCLIFIPIISQTYCDPKSFAWQHEFCAFNKLCKEDELGRDIKLSSGNVASRILPIKIHDLDADDKATLENEIGGVLRAIEFIYKESGVNRPLHSTDDKNDNQNKIDYRNQVNKVANAIKEIISALKNPVVPSPRIPISEPSVTKPRQYKNAIIGLFLFLFVAALGYFVYQRQASDNNQQLSINKSIAVLPFVNLSNDPDQEYFSDGLSEELLNLLAKNSDLKVIARTSSFSFKNKQEDIRAIGKKLDVAHILEGSVRRSGNKIRITAQLISVENGAHLWSETYDTEATDIFEIQDKIAGAIVKELKLLLKNPVTESIEPEVTDLTTYELYLKARQKLAIRGNSLLEARQLFEKVIARDSKYSNAYSGLSRALSLIPEFTYSQFDEKQKIVAAAYKNADKALEINPKNAEAMSVLGYLNVIMDWNWKFGGEYLLKSVALEPNNAENVNFLGDYYRTTSSPLAVETEARAFNLDPLHTVNSQDLALSYFFVGNNVKAILQMSEAIKLDSSFYKAYWYLTHFFIVDKQFDKAENILNLMQKHFGEFHKTRTLELTARFRIAQGKSSEALTLIEILKNETTTNDDAFFTIAQLYSLMGLWGDAAIYYEKAYALKSVQFRNILLLDQYPPTSEIYKILNKPEFNELFEIRRANQKLN